MTDGKVIAALRSLADGNGGVLRPEEVVKAARPIKSALHDKFTWDDSEAAHQFRLEEARRLIRTTIQYLEVDGKDKSFRVFCSLTTDRSEDGGGYREISAVLSNKTFRDQLVADAYAEMGAFKNRYEKIKELAGVIREIRKALAANEEDSESSKIA